MVSPTRFKWAALALYLGMGWAGILVGGEMFAALPGPVIVLMLVGGNKLGFEATFRVAAYGEAASILALVPFCGGVIGVLLGAGLASLAAFLAAGLTMYSGFGLGTLMLPVFALFLPVEMAVVATALVHGANNVFKVSLLGRHADREVVLRFGLTAIAAAILGALMLGWLVRLNAELLGWVLENLIKNAMNAVDAAAGRVEGSSGSVALHGRSPQSTTAPVAWI